MDKETIAEVSYKNGYIKGYEDGKRDAIVCSKCITPTVTEEKSVDIHHCLVYMSVQCGANKNTKFCSYCGVANGLTEV